MNNTTITHCITSEITEATYPSPPEGSHMRVHHPTSALPEDQVSQELGRGSAANQVCPDRGSGLRCDMRANQRLRIQIPCRRFRFLVTTELITRSSATKVEAKSFGSYPCLNAVVACEKRSDEFPVMHEYDLRCSSCVTSGMSPT